VRIRLPSGVRVFFDVEGAGLVPEGPRLREQPTIVLIHGAEVDHAFFKPWLSPLAEVAQLVYLDLPSHGRSDLGSPGRWDLDHWADDVHAFCRLLDIEHPVVLGSSLGGRVAMVYGARHADHPRALILVNTAAVNRLDRRMAMFGRLGGPAAAEAARRDGEEPSPAATADYHRLCMPLLVQRPYSDDELARLTPVRPEVFARLVQLAHAGEDLTAVLAAIRCPVLVATGELDPLATPDDAKDIVSHLGSDRNELVIFPGAGHGVFRDTPDAFIGAVREFLEATATG